MMSSFVFFASFIFLFCIGWLGVKTNKQVTYLLTLLFFSLFVFCFCLLFGLVLFCCWDTYVLFNDNFFSSYALYLQKMCSLHWIIICIIILLMRFMEFYPIKTLELFPLITFTVFLALFFSFLCTVEVGDQHRKRNEECLHGWGFCDFCAWFFSFWMLCLWCFVWQWVILIMLSISQRWHVNTHVLG